MMFMKKSKAKSELSKIAKSYLIPPYDKKALFQGVREAIQKIEEEHGKCTYEVKCLTEATGLPTLKIIPRRVERASSS
jgi:hypothetical protein